MAKERRKTRTGTVLILLLIAVLMLIAGFGMMTFLKSQRTTVYVFNAAYPEGTQVNGDMFTQIQIDTSTYALLSGTESAYAKREEIVAAIEAGDRLSAGVVSGLPVTANLFMTNGGTGVESRLADGKAAVEILSSRVYGLSGNEVRAGSRINLTAYSNVNDVERSELIYQDMLILDVVSDENGALVSVYVECDPEDLVMLQHALVTDSVSVSVLRPGSYSPLEGEALRYERNTDREDDPEESGLSSPKIDYWKGYLN